MAVNYNQVTSAALEILAESPDRRWGSDALAQEIVSRTGYANTKRIKPMLLWLTGAGLIEGIGNSRAGGWARFRHKTPDKDQGGFTEAMAKAEVKRERDLREELERGFNELKQISAARAEEINALKDRVKQSEGAIKEVRIKSGTGKVRRKVKEVFHAKFSKLMDLATARKNIFLFGPTQCGKTFICNQLARCQTRTVGKRGKYKVGDPLPFYFISCTAGMSEGKLEGRLLPTGANGRFEYTVSEFVKAYEDGGVFLLDEMDAADPNVVLIINTALANDQMAVPNRPENPVAQRSPDFVFVATANTVGTGASRLYSGRNKLDGSTLARFSCAKVSLYYDARIESQLCPDEELRGLCQRVRKAIEDHSMERAMTTKDMMDMHHMKSEFNWSYEDLFGLDGSDGFMAGWREDEIHKITIEVPELKDPSMLRSNDKSAAGEVTDDAGYEYDGEFDWDSLPALRGTVKQVTWAKDIRRRAIETMLCKKDHPEVISRMAGAALKNYAKWWIENRNVDWASTDTLTFRDV